MHALSAWALLYSHSEESSFLSGVIVMVSFSRFPLLRSAFAASALLASFLALTISAGAQVVGGTIAGYVTDPSAAAVSGAAVFVHSDETGTERRLHTAADGRYAAPSIPVGSYTVSVHAEGFAAGRRTGIPLSVGQG